LTVAVCETETESDTEGAFEVAAVETRLEQLALREEGTVEGLSDMRGTVQVCVLKVKKGCFQRASLIIHLWGASEVRRHEGRTCLNDEVTRSEVKAQWNGTSGSIRLAEAEGLVQLRIIYKSIQWAVLECV
jgi:hypothetical protein